MTLGELIAKLQSASNEIGEDASVYVTAARGEIYDIDLVDADPGVVVDGFRFHEAKICLTLKD